MDLFELDVLWWADPAAGEWCCELELWVRLDMGGCWGWWCDMLRRSLDRIPVGV